MTLTTFALDINNDITLDINNDIAIATGIDGLKHSIRQFLYFFKDSFIYAKGKGIPYFDDSLEPQDFADILLAELLDEFGEYVTGVKDVSWSIVDSVYIFQFTFIVENDIIQEELRITRGA